MEKLKGKLTYANVAATLALVIAVGGGTAAIAGVKIAPKNSVVSKSIRAGNVTASDLAKAVLVNSIAQVAPGSSGDVTARCPAGMRAIGGNGSGGSLPITATGVSGAQDNWFVSVGPNQLSTSVQITASVWCLNTKAG
jgi:hypothetical protein